MITEICRCGGAISTEPAPAGQPGKVVGHTDADGNRTTSCRYTTVEES